MENRKHTGSGEQGGNQGANTAGNKNQLAGNQGNPENQGRAQGEKPGQHQYDSHVENYGDPHRTRLAKHFVKEHGLSKQQSENAADSFLGSVNWASQQKRDDDFKDFVNPKTPYSKNPLYGDWQDEYKKRLRKNGLDDTNVDKLGSEKVDEVLRDLSTNGADENWYRNYGNDGRDVSDDGRRDRISDTASENSDGTDAEGMTRR